MFGIKVINSRAYAIPQRRNYCLKKLMLYKIQDAIIKITNLGLDSTLKRHVTVPIPPK
jgi:hypothetical protein